MIDNSCSYHDYDYYYYHHCRDTAVFDRCGLLTNRTVLAHGVHLNDDEVILLKDRGSAVAHCPLSNFFFAR